MRQAGVLLRSLVLQHSQVLEYKPYGLGLRICVADGWCDMQTQERASELLREMIGEGMAVDLLHASKTKKQRDATVDAFRTGKVNSGHPLKRTYTSVVCDLHLGSCCLCRIPSRASCSASEEVKAFSRQYCVRQRRVIEGESPFRRQRDDKTATVIET